MTPTDQEHPAQPLRAVAALAEGIALLDLFSSWTPYRTREAGEVFDANEVREQVAEVRAVLAQAAPEEWRSAEGVPSHVCVPGCAPGSHIAAPPTCPCLPGAPEHVCGTGGYDHELCCDLRSGQDASPEVS